MLPVLLPSRCRFLSEALIRRFLQSSAQLSQVARTGGSIQLRSDQLFPCCAHGIERSRQHEHERAVRDAGQTTTLQGARTDRLERQHSEEFSKTVDRFVQQGCHCFWRAIPTRKTRSTVCDHSIHTRIRDPTADHGADVVTIVGTDGSLHDVMTCVEQLSLQVITTGVVLQGAAVRNGEQGNVQGHGALASRLDARTAWVDGDPCFVCFFLPR